MTDENTVTEEAADGDVEQAEPPDVQQQAISESEFSAEIRNLLDIAIQSGIDADHAEDILREHSQKTEAYYEDFFRYNQQPEQGSSSEEVRE